MSNAFPVNLNNILVQGFAEIADCLDIFYGNRFEAKPNDVHLLCNLNVKNSNLKFKTKNTYFCTSRF